jgi:hypothetical protein
MSEQIQSSGFLVRKNIGIRRFPSGGTSYTPGPRRFFTNYKDAIKWIEEGGLRECDAFEIEAVKVSVIVEG